VAVCEAASVTVTIKLYVPALAKVTTVDFAPLVPLAL
jgi:hypothetical protein